MIYLKCVALLSYTMLLTLVVEVLCTNLNSHLQEQPAFDKKQFVTFMKRYIKNLTAKLEPEQQAEFKKGIEGATKYLLGKLKDL